MSAARLAAEALIWRNRHARIKLNKAAVALPASIGVLAVVIFERQTLALFVNWLHSYGVWCSVLAAIFSAVAIARRRASKRTQFPRSWLAAVPARKMTARWEGLLIETLPAGFAVAALCGVALLLLLTLPFEPNLGIKAIFGVWSCLSGGVVAGVALSFLVPAPKPVDLPPGSRYVPKLRVNRTAAIRPSLSGLGRWPIRQMFAWAQPKVVARTLIPVLLMMPLGTKADEAMIGIAVFVVLFTIVLLCGAVTSVSGHARRWLAPAPVRRIAVIRALLLPACGMIAAASAIGALLLLVFNVSYRISAAVAAITAVTGCVTIAIALLWKLRPRRVP